MTSRVIVVRSADELMLDDYSVSVSLYRHRSVHRYRGPRHIVCIRGTQEEDHSGNLQEQFTNSINNWDVCNEVDIFWFVRKQLYLATLILTLLPRKSHRMLCSAIFNKLGLWSCKRLLHVTWAYDIHVHNLKNCSFGLFLPFLWVTWKPFALRKTQSRVMHYNQYLSASMK